MLGLMFLKHYLNLSDKQLITRFNTDWSLQLFCGKLLKQNELIRDMSLPFRIRSYVAENVDLNEVQSILLSHWKTDMEHTHVLCMDATAYESYIRFPTDVKLLWESNQWVYEKLLFKLCRLTGEKRPRNKYIDQKKKQLTYSRMRRKSYKKGKVRKRSLLYLLRKGLILLQDLLNSQPIIQLTKEQYSRIRTIRKVLEQQQYMFDHPSEKVAERIVSLHKPYIRPIVRGKENKAVEFGMKAHMLQCDGITYIETMSFNAFNECKRLKVSVLKHKMHFKESHQVSADRIYATNENRRYVTAKAIFTNFAKKGAIKLPKTQKIRQAQLNKVSSTQLEGSFGNHKNHYGLRKIKARGEENERVWVLFGVMAANAKKMVGKKASDQNKLAA